jgi:hypothetical protein
LWKTTDLSTYPGSEHNNTSSTAWKQRYKDWTYRLWTDADVEDLLVHEYLWLLPQYRAYANDIQRADLARLLILHHEGGVYVDLDGYPWDTTVDEYPELLTYDAVFSLTSNRLVTNHFMLARRHSAFLGYCLHHSHRTVLHLWWLHYLDVFYSTGPLFLHKMLGEYTALADASQLAAATAGATALSTAAAGATAAEPAPAAAGAATDAPSKPSPPTQAKRPNRQPTPHRRIRESILILNPDNTNAFVNHRGGRSWMSDGERGVNWLVDRGAGGLVVGVVGVVVLLGALGVAAVAVAGASAPGGRKARSAKTGQHRSKTGQHQQQSV